MKATSGAAFYAMYQILHKEWDLQGKAEQMQSKQTSGGFGKSKHPNGKLLGTIEKELSGSTAEKTEFEAFEQSLKLPESSPAKAIS